MVLVAGVDSSTTATKVVVRDAESGHLVRSGRAEHPAGTEVPPECWWEALVAAGDGLFGGVAAVAVAAQQHGMVVLDDRAQVVRPALLWNDVRSAGAADDLVAELGGPAAWAAAVGSVPLASFTVSKLRWLAVNEPRNAARVTQVMLPHDYLTWRLGGMRQPPATDRGDASGTGYWSPHTGEYRLDLLELALGHVAAVPRVLAPTGTAGETGDGALLAAGTGDNMAAALGCGARPGDAVMSIGTSGVVAAVHDRPTADATGTVAGFADATGRFLPLVCTLNAAQVLAATARILGVDLDELDARALTAAPGAGGVVLLPYFEGERTPNLPTATATFAGLRLASATPENVARAAVEGLLCGLADGLDALRGVGARISHVRLVGGGARSRAVRALAPALLGVPVVVPEPGEYVADGAARQAAWAFAGTPDPPDWPVPGTDKVLEAEPDRDVRAAYHRARDAIRYR